MEKIHYNLFLRYILDDEQRGRWWWSLSGLKWEQKWMMGRGDGGGVLWEQKAGGERSTLQTIRGRETRLNLLLIAAPTNWQGDHFWASSLTDRGLSTCGRLAGLTNGTIWLVFSISMNQKKLLEKLERPQSLAGLASDTIWHGVPQSDMARQSDAELSPAIGQGWLIALGWAWWQLGDQINEENLDQRCSWKHWTDFGRFISEVV